MGDFDSVVRVSRRVVRHIRHHHSARRRVASKLVRDDSSRLGSMTLDDSTEKARGRLSIAPRLDQDVSQLLN